MAAAPTKWIYFFGEAGIKEKALLGGKGAGLGEMTMIGLPVPAGFTITTKACVYYMEKKAWPAGLEAEVATNLARLEAKAGKKFGDVANPLLVSVRSGAKVSMPGMMDTVLNLGMNPAVMATVARMSGDERFAHDSYRRFIQMYGDVVMGVPHHDFEHEIDVLKKEKGVKLDVELDTAALRTLIDRYLALVRRVKGVEFPTDPAIQLREAINAVFQSWNNDRAITYRNLNGIPHDMGTAVNVQEMVYGNMGEGSATGVAFTRDPSTGANHCMGEYLPNAQGEDVVAGIRTPFGLDHMATAMPAVHRQLMDVFNTLEHHFHDMQDVEFTIERNKLFVLQTRNAKRTAAAALKAAVDMVHEGLITKQNAVLRLEPPQMDQLLHPMFDPAALKAAKVAAKGLNASPGAAVGTVVFTAKEAEEKSKLGVKVVLVRLETSPEDIAGMAVSEGVLTARGGMTSHAAVVARGMNLPCITGCGDMVVMERERKLSLAGVEIKEGETLSLDGATGNVYVGKIPVVKSEVSGDLAEFLGYTGEFARLHVMANADIGRDAKVSVKFGARGIGLCRTEHMFFDPARILHVREMICAKTLEQRKAGLDKLLPYQQSDFADLFEAMSGFPVVIRLLDPPLHEFLPQEEDQIRGVAAEMKIPFEELREKVKAMHEFNPMLGFRGCRVGVIHEEIYEMQVHAAFRAAHQVKAKGKNPRPWIEIPLVGNIKEYMPLKRMVKRVAIEEKAEGVIDYAVGSMLEVPRAALTSAELAPECDFFSFGTNDLTQMTCGFSRDDSGTFLKKYVELGIYARNPFQSIDQEGVGKLMKMAIEGARKIKPDIDISICGEHGGEPISVAFCHKIGLNSVSCSPFRVPIARLAAAQAALTEAGFSSH